MINALKNFLFGKSAFKPASAAQARKIIAEPTEAPQEIASPSAAESPVNHDNVLDTKEDNNVQEASPAAGIAGHDTPTVDPVVPEPAVNEIEKKDQNPQENISPQDLTIIEKFAATTDQPAAAIPATRPVGQKPPRPRKVFVVESPKDRMSRDGSALLKRLGFEPIVLDFSGRYQGSVEERIKQNPDVNFAVVMLAGEEFSYPKDGKPKDTRLRASQVTTFLLGYLLAKFGRQNTFVLYWEQESFSLPTDMQNVIYTPYNPLGDWRQLLINRLRISGYEIDEKIDVRREYL